MPPSAYPLAPVKTPEMARSCAARQKHLDFPLGHVLITIVAHPMRLVNYACLRGPPPLVQRARGGLSVCAAVWLVLH